MKLDIFTKVPIYVNFDEKLLNHKKDLIKLLINKETYKHLKIYDFDSNIRTKLDNMMYDLKLTKNEELSSKQRVKNQNSSKKQVNNKIYNYKLNNFLNTKVKKLSTLSSRKTSNLNEIINSLNKRKTYSFKNISKTDSFQFNSNTISSIYKSRNHELKFSNTLSKVADDNNLYREYFQLEQSKCKQLIKSRNEKSINISKFILDDKQKRSNTQFISRTIVNKDNLINKIELRLKEKKSKFLCLITNSTDSKIENKNLNRNTNDKFMREDLEKSREKKQFSMEKSNLFSPGKIKINNFCPMKEFMKLKTFDIRQCLKNKLLNKEIK